MPNTESSRIEYKRELSDGLERAVVSFLNYREGGVVYIGIDDNGAVVGVDDMDGTQLKIISRIKDNILPSAMGLFDVVAEEKAGKRIIKVVVSSGMEKPYYLKSKGMSPAGCFLRVGSSAQPMTTNQIDALFASRLPIRLGNIPSPRQQLTFKQLKIYYEDKGLSLNEEFLRSLDLADERGVINYIGYLLADSNGVSVRVAKYAGTDKVNLIENEEFGYGCLITATFRVLDKLRVENKTFTKITSSRRLERHMVDPTALREAVINAIVHNDYTRETTPQIEIFSDRITITSYGGLPAGLSREDFFRCCSMPRNRELMRIFRDVDLVEHLGSGMSRILSAYDTSIFEFLPNFLKVTFPFEEGFSLPNGNESGNEFGNEAADAILRAIEQNPAITLDAISQQTGIPKRTVSRETKALQEAGRLKRIGGARGGHWEIENVLPQ